MDTSLPGQFICLFRGTKIETILLFFCFTFLFTPLSDAWLVRLCDKNSAQIILALWGPLQSNLSRQKSLQRFSSQNFHNVCACGLS